MHSNETVGGYVLRKPIIRQKRTISNNLKVPETVQGGHLNVFWNPFCCKISKKKLKGFLLDTMTKISQKKQKNDNFEVS